MNHVILNDKTRTCKTIKIITASISHLHRRCSAHTLGIELGQEVKVLLEVCGEYRLDDEEAKALELHVIQVEQEVELRLGQIEAPGRRRVMVLQHRAVVVQHGLSATRGVRRGGGRVGGKDRGHVKEKVCSLI